MSIEILSKSLSAQIAAGEVIERPAAVVKELLENSVDAKSTRVDIEFKSGGKNFIKVSDNGTGMSKEEALLSLEQHATSKIKTSQDLFSIATFGFRGEALPSMASVSNFTLKTRNAESNEGVEIFVRNKNVEYVRACGMPIGTEIIVENLFSTVPARRKFLKSDEVESSHIIKLCRLYALALPHIAISLTENGKVLFKSEKDLPLPSQVSKIFGSNFGDKFILLPKVSRGDMSVTGMIMKVGESFASSKNIYAFVNSRPVTSKAIFFALKDAYSPYLPSDKYAGAILFLTLNPNDVDINVHPAKTEVRFRNDAAIKDFILQSLAEHLESVYKKATVVEENKNEALRTFVSPFVSPVLQKVENLEYINPIQRTEIETGQMPQQTSSSGVAGWTYFGRVENKYDIFKYENSLKVLNIKAALARVYYEEILANMNEKKPSSQSLLFPENLELERSENEVFVNLRKYFERCGFVIEDFGKNFYRIEAFPSWLSDTECLNFVRDFIEVAKEESFGVADSNQAREKFAKLAMKNARSLRIAEGERASFDLLSKLLDCKVPTNSPDGLYTIKELDNNFFKKLFS